MVQPYFTARLAEERVRDLRASASRSSLGRARSGRRTGGRVVAALAESAVELRAWFRRGQLGPVPDARCATC
jgi:hypothetical protein